MVDLEGRAIGEGVVAEGVTEGIDVHAVLVAQREAEAEGLRAVGRLVGVAGIPIRHPLVLRLEVEDVERVADGGDPSHEESWGIQGPGCGTRADWRDEFSVDAFLFLWEREVERRGVRGPELVVRYPYLAGGSPERLPGITDLEMLSKGAALVATADPFHHGIGYGDAPDAAASPGFPTLLSHNGARHQVDGVTYLGAAAPDVEPDGQPDGTATGDDLAGTDDEDGVTFSTALVPGFTAQVDVVASVPGYLDAWIDFNGNGSWADSGEQIAASYPMNPGMNPVAFPVPATAAAGGMMARFRFSTMGGLAPTGLATDGEVEDYEVQIEDAIYDYGDAPDPTYPTLKANSGAVHQVVEGILLGTYADGEADGQNGDFLHGDGTNDWGTSPCAIAANRARWKMEF